MVLSQSKTHQKRDQDDHSKGSRDRHEDDIREFHLPIRRRHLPAEEWRTNWSKGHDGGSKDLHAALVQEVQGDFSEVRPEDT